MDYNSLFSYPCFHAYILEGDRENNEKAVTELSMRILCNEKNPCRKCDTCQKILSSNHTDIKKAEGGLKIGEIREFLSDLYLTPSDGDRKIYVFYDADTIPELSQNVLLLPIEEPPEGVYFILCCSSSEGILQTVKSRCRHILIGKQNTSDEEKEKICEKFFSLLESKNTAEMLSFFDSKKDSRADFYGFTVSFCDYCRKMVKKHTLEKNNDEISVYLSLLAVSEKWAKRAEMNLNMNLSVAGFISDCRNCMKGL